ncbi:hypothetical protein RHA1_ro07084 [Rhodococcus jostii RHA1]|uniref:Uncharacterized protein n=1 Tax=Rhodococcus jostii (strain RHA1) TaxID=101510 RepID=Q0S0T8_RHOJR|nr:hypothetical protein RHA1_ro07084 [Rhodococcus jostii RHA1]
MEVFQDGSYPCTAHLTDLGRSDQRAPRAPPSWASATSPTTSPGACWKPVDSDPLTFDEPHTLPIEDLGGQVGVRWKRACI